SMRAAIRDAVAKCDRWLDQYPLQNFEQDLQRLVADVKETAVSPAEASAELQAKLVAFFQTIEGPAEWEVVIGVYGIAAGEQAFVLGPCRFHIMNETELNRWGQRARCGCYDPPPGILPLFDRTGLDQYLLGNWVATVRVRAVDSTHAEAKAR